MQVKSSEIAIVGAGLLGRLLAVQLAQRNVGVTLLDRDLADGKLSCAYTGAGMLAPYAELDASETIIYDWGITSLRLWPQILSNLAEPVFFQQSGTLVVSHSQDKPDFQRFQTHLTAKLNEANAVGGLVSLNAGDLAQLEPQLANRFQSGLFLPHEGQIDNRGLLASLAETIRALGIDWQTGIDCQTVSPNTIRIDGQIHQFDWVIDCRGLGAQSDWPQLRGVRGELIRVVAPDVTLNRPIRLMHPRYPLYIVPRPNQRFLIGATQLESDDNKPITVQSAMELLSAAFTVHSAFAEAHIEELTAQCRPSLQDNLPRIQIQNGLMRINGLYRHGFLIAPVLIQTAMCILNGEKISANVQPYLQYEKESRDAVLVD